VVGQKYATTKIITKLKIGPIHMMCLSNVGSIQEPVTIPVLSGFPTYQGKWVPGGNLSYTNAGWTKAGSIRTKRRLGDHIPNGQQFETRGVRFKRRQPGRDEHHHQGRRDRHDRRAAADGTIDLPTLTIRPHAQN